MLLKTILSLPLLLLVACGGQGEGVRYGKTTKAALTAQKGEPLAEDKPVEANKELSVLIYADDERYQVQGDIVVAGFRSPTEPERSLLYWKHKFKSCSTSQRKLDSDGSHLKPKQELTCARDGISVIYDPNVDQVTRIVEQAHEE